jgi:hypothetical protein
MIPLLGLSAAVLTTITAFLGLPGAFIKADNIDALCRAGLLRCDPPKGGRSMGTLPGLGPSLASPPATPQTPRPTGPVPSWAPDPTPGPSKTKPITPAPSPGPSTPRPTPRPEGQKYEGTYRGHIGWSGRFVKCADVVNIGWRDIPHSTCQIFADSSGIRSTNGVTITRVRKAEVGYADCRTAEYGGNTFIRAADIRQYDYICADEGTQYIAAYKVVALPTAQEGSYEALGISWFRD